MRRRQDLDQEKQIRHGERERESERERSTQAGGRAGEDRGRSKHCERGCCGCECVCTCVWMCERERRRSWEKFHILAASGKLKKKHNNTQIDLRGWRGLKIVFVEKNCLSVAFMCSSERESGNSWREGRREWQHRGGERQDYNVTACRMWFTSDMYSELKRWEISGSERKLTFILGGLW